LPISNYKHEIAVIREERNSSEFQKQDLGAEIKGIKSIERG